MTYPQIFVIKRIELDIREIGSRRFAIISGTFASLNAISAVFYHIIRVKTPITSFHACTHVLNL
jgi:hypothetical protein